ncbi:RNA-guided endonuclease InsQ/TnpB family protein [Streptomyces longispororuber]|uniref:RNA-guided endonuclease InsQ/TnpB family protein n=1 Tax=Streptomyces longispororuber TaxID=68230 RepID=UPI00167D689F|nr:RNA-guided endonuclease TnpB family protein [Streptomyces longispororuber]
MRLPLDPTPVEQAILQRYADCSRACYNFAFSLKDAAQRRWAAERDRLIADGMQEKAARKAATARFAVPRQFDLQKIFLAVRDRPFTGPERAGEPFPRYRYRWWAGVNAMVCQQAFRDADRAWSNWLSRSREGHGYPRPKQRGRCKDSFRLPGVSLAAEDLRHIRISGERRPGGQKAFRVRLHRPAYRLARLLQQGGQVKMVTVSRSGPRWFAAFNVRLPAPPAVVATRAQRRRGAVGVDLGVEVIAATSQPVLLQGAVTQLVANPRYLANARRALAKWERRKARRWVKGLPAGQQSRGWHEAKDHVAKLHALIAAHRASTQHHLTKALVTQFAQVVIEDLQVKNMSKSAKGTLEDPGSRVRQKAGLNRALLDVGFGEIRRQLAYKAPWYGSVLSAVNPAYTSQTCHRCGHVDSKSRRTRSVFECTACGTQVHADIGAAHNILARGQQTPAALF